MPSILDGLNSVQQGLATQQFALSITQRNVAKANDPSYTREDVIYTGDENEWARSGVAGVSLKAVRDRFLDYSISRETQLYSQNSVESDALQQIDALFNGSGQDLQQALSDFFNSFASLTSDPQDLTLRQKVLTSANALTTEFHRLYAGIQNVRTSEDRALTSTVDDVNAITAQIADLNKKIQTAQGARSEDEFTLRDSRQQLIEQLSGLTDLSYYETESGSITVTTRQGAALVIGDQVHALSLAPSGTGVSQGVFLDGVEITASLQSGKLGGLIDIRDNKTAGYLTSLDNLAATIISSVNTQHVKGSDLRGNPGNSFFVPFAQPAPGSNAGAAASMTVALTDPRDIAAAAANTAVGNNDNAKLLAAIGNQTLFQSYSDLVYTIGSDEKTADDNVSTQKSILDQLKNQRDSSSGVNMDEEAVNLVKFQKAYQAIARFANVLDSLSNEILNLLGA
jgi:flagellar hook-associated protein 1